jgi:hypothetical protein
MIDPTPDVASDDPSPLRDAGCANARTFNREPESAGPPGERCSVAPAIAESTKIPTTMIAEDQSPRAGSEGRDVGLDALGGTVLTFTSHLSWPPHEG